MIKIKNKIRTLFLIALITTVPSAVFAVDATGSSTDINALEKVAYNNNISNEADVLDNNVLVENTKDSNEISKEDQDNSDTYNVGWVKNEDGTYFLYDGLGSMVKSSWCKVGGKWYYLNDDGTMATGWLKNNGEWYYLGQWGNMHTGWVKDGGLWYYLNEDGIMQKGWIYSHNSWYYLNEYGAMVTNAVIDGYTLGADGTCQ